MDSIRMFGLAVLTGSLLMTHAVNAGDVVVSTAAEDRSSPINIVGPEGFVIQLPAVDIDALAEQLRELRSSLISRKQKLANELETKQFDSGDTLLALVMPGGLIYAGYKKAACARARHDLDEVSETIAEYSGDLALLQAQLQPVAVAQLQ